MTLVHGFCFFLILATPIACAVFSEWRSVNKAMDTLFDLPDDSYIIFHARGGQADTPLENTGMCSCSVIPLFRSDLGGPLAPNDRQGFLRDALATRYPAAPDPGVICQPKLLRLERGFAIRSQR